MAASITIQSINKLQNAFLVVASIALSGNYALHGDTLNLTSAALPVQNAEVPLFATIDEFPATSASASGFVFKFAPGTTLANGKIQVFESAGSAAPLVELAAGAYPAGLTSAKLKIQALIPAL